MGVFVVLTQPDITKMESMLTEKFPQNYYKICPGQWLVSATLEMQRSLGKVEQAIASLSEQSKKHDEKLDSIGKTVHSGKILLIVAGALLSALISAFGGIGLFFLNKLWNALIPLLQIKPHP